MALLKRVQLDPDYLWRFPLLVYLMYLCAVTRPRRFGPV